MVGGGAVALGLGLVFLQLLAVPGRAGVVELTDTNFDRYLKEEGPLFVQFYADWHGACQRFEESWKALASELAGQLTVGRINFNDQRNLTERFGVTTLPTFKFIYGAGIAVGYEGDLNATQLAAAGLALLRPQVATVSTQSELASRFALPFAAFVLFHDAADDAALEAFMAGVRPFLQSRGAHFVRSHSLEWARALVGAATPMPFVAVVKDWDQPGQPAATAPVHRLTTATGRRDAGHDDNDDDDDDATRALVTFLERHRQPLVPRLEAASAHLREALQQAPSAIGIVISVVGDPASREALELANIVRTVAKEYHHQGAPAYFVFAWVEGPAHEHWLSEFGVGSAEFDSHVFVFDPLRNAHFAGASVHSVDDLRSYMDRLARGQVKAQKVVPLKKQQQQKREDVVQQHQQSSDLLARLLGLAEALVKWLELPAWWRPSHWGRNLVEVVTESSDAAARLSLVVGLVLSFALVCFNRHLCQPTASLRQPPLAEPQNNNKNSDGQTGKTSKDAVAEGPHDGPGDHDGVAELGVRRRRAEAHE